MANLGPLLSSLRNVINIPDLRTRLLFMLGLLAVYRMGSWIPTPGVDTLALQQLFEQQAGTIFGFLDIFSGGNLSRLSIFALGIMPYITASIILQLLTVVWPYLERLSKEGQLGSKEDHPVHALSYRRPGPVSELRHITGPAADGFRSSHCPQSRVGLYPHDHADLNHGNRFCHVDRGADIRARHWKWDLTDYFRWHCSGPGPSRDFPGAGFASAPGVG